MYLFILSMKNTTQEVNKVKIFTAVSEGIMGDKGTLLLSCMVCTVKKRQKQRPPVL